MNFKKEIGDVKLSITSQLNNNKELTFPGSSVVKKLPANAEDAQHSGSIPGLGKSPGV